jgi:hypothetical protein
MFCSIHLQFSFSQSKFLVHDREFMFVFSSCPSMMLNRKHRSAGIQRRLLHQRGDHQVAESPKSNGNDGSERRTIPHWAIYTLAISGAVLFVVVAATATYLLFSRRKKDNTVTPWSIGLSGPLRKAFVAGQFLIFHHLTRL